MSIDDLVGHTKEVKPTTTSNLINTELFELVTPKSHGTSFSFNMLKILPGGLVKEQSHSEQHFVFILDGECEILLGEKKVSIQKGNYLYIPPGMTHSFSNIREIPVEILILKI